MHHPNTKTSPPLSLCKGGAVWIPALSAIGAGFAIGLAAIGSGVGQAPNTCPDTCAFFPFTLRP